MTQRTPFRAARMAAAFLVLASGPALAQVVPSSCTATAGNLTLTLFLNTARKCQPSTPLGKALSALQKLECAEKGTLAALESFGLRVNISSTPPTVPAASGAHHDSADDFGVSGVPAGQALGLYFSVQNLVWASNEYPAAILAEAVHALDDFVFCTTCPATNPVLNSGVDPTFAVIHSSYVARVQSGGLLLGSQGANPETPVQVQRVELLMEAGIWCRLGHGGVTGTPIHSPSESCAMIQQSYPQLHQYVLDVLEYGSLMRKPAPGS